MPENKATLLLSRQPIRPSRFTPWIKNTVKALQWIKANNYELISSTGMQTWDMITATASIMNIRQEIYIISNNSSDYENQKKYLIEQFEISSSNAKFHAVFPESGKSHLHLRDELVLNRANILIPISIRSNGFMMSYIKSKKNNQILIDRFQTKYKKRSEPLKYTIKKDQLNPAFPKLNNSYLIHWTRTANYYWPDETIISYWKDIISSDEYPKSAYHTLKHILSTGIIKSSSRHMPLGVKTVSFTSLPPVEALSLMKWRSRYCEMSFEPYGIAIEKNWGIKNGITAVRYYDTNSKQKPKSDEKWFSQSKGIKTDWQKEYEYRSKNDFNLQQVPNDKLIAFCYKPDEIHKLKAEFKIKVISISS